MQQHEYNSNLGITSINITEFKSRNNNTEILCNRLEINLLIEMSNCQKQISRLRSLKGLSTGLDSLQNHRLLILFSIFILTLIIGSDSFKAVHFIFVMYIMVYHIIDWYNCALVLLS